MTKKNLYAQKHAAAKAQKLAKKVAAKKAAALPVGAVPSLHIGGQSVKPVEVKPGVYAYDIETTAPTKPVSSDEYDPAQTAALLSKKCPHGVRTNIESCEQCDRRIHLTVDEVVQVEEALVAARQLLQLVQAPLLGLSSPAADTPAAEVVTKAKAAETLIRTALRRESFKAVAHPEQP